MAEENKSSVYKDEIVEWGGLLNEFLWVCAGANRKVLRQCPTDYAKYAGIGGTILFTALMAMISGGYALYFVFNDVRIATAFGIFWGLLIFNLDRFIVNTMYSDGKVTISWKEFTSGLPRIIMAIFLGIVISTPLEMKIFEDRINSQLVIDNQRRSNDTRISVEEKNRPLQERIDSLNRQKAEIQQELAAAERALKEEGEGSALSGKPGHGPIYQEKEIYYERKREELSAWEANNNADLADLKAQIKENKGIGNDNIKESRVENGFCVRYEAFSTIKRENASLNIVSFVIMLLFIIIETAPTFFKMMIASGPYDDYLRAEMHKVRVLSDKRISDLNDDVNTEVLISTRRNKERGEAEVRANKELMERLAKAQAELLQTAIDRWRDEELEKINQDPSQYIKTNTKG